MSVPAGVVAQAAGQAAGLEAMARRDLDPAALVGRRVLHERDEPAGHEPARSHRLPAPGDFAHFDHPARRGHLDRGARPAWR